MLSFRQFLIEAPEVKPNSRVLISKFGTADPLEVLMKIDPELTVEQAKAFLEKNPKKWYSLLQTGGLEKTLSKFKIDPASIETPQITQGAPKRTQEPVWMKRTQAPMGPTPTQLKAREELELFKQGGKPPPPSVQGPPAPAVQGSAETPKAQIAVQVPDKTQLKTFSFEAMTTRGEEVNSTIEAVDMDDALKRIRQQNMFPTSVRPPKEAPAPKKGFFDLFRRTDQAAPQGTQRPQGPTTVSQAAQAAQSPQPEKGGKLKSGARAAVSTAVGLGLDKSVDYLSPELSSWAEKANLNLGNVDVSARDLISAGVFELGSQATDQLLGGPKMTGRGLAAGSVGYLAGAKMGQSLARTLGAEEGGIADSASELAGGIVGQLGVQHVGVKPLQASPIVRGARNIIPSAEDVSKFGKGVSRASIAGARPSNLAPLTKLGGAVGRALPGAQVAYTVYDEFNKSPTDFKGFGAETTNIATQAALGLAIPAAVSGGGALLTGAGALGAGVAAGGAMIAAAPLVVAAAGVMAGAAMGRAALSNISERDNARANLETQRILYHNNKSKMTPQQRAETEERLRKLAATNAQEEQGFGAALADTYKERTGEILGLVGLEGPMNQKELKSAISAKSEEGMKDIKTTKDETGKVTAIQSDVADEWKRRAEETARQSGAKTAAEVDAEQASQIASLKKQAEENTKTEAGRAKIKEVETEEEKRLKDSAKETIYHAMEAGYEIDPETLKSAGMNLESDPDKVIASDEGIAMLQRSADNPEQFKETLRAMGREAQKEEDRRKQAKTQPPTQSPKQAGKELSFDEWRKRFG